VRVALIRREYITHLDVRCDFHKHGVYEH